MIPSVDPESSTEAPPDSAEPVAHEHPGRQRTPAMSVAAAALGIALVALGGGFGLGWALGRALVGPQASTAGHPAISAIARAEAAIVDINTNLPGGYQAAGTGMVLTSTGEVLTNNHVVAGATNIEVTVPSTSDTYGAHVLGTDPRADVAVIQLVGASKLPTIHIAHASALKVGVQVVALGNALGQGGAPSLSNGAIIALNQAITAAGENGASEKLTGVVETDAPINQGDSGGALVDSSGAVLGMITAGELRGYQSSGTESGFAVPMTVAMGIVRQIEAKHATDGIIIGGAG